MGLCASCYSRRDVSLLLSLSSTFFFKYLGHKKSWTSGLCMGVCSSHSWVAFLPKFLYGQQYTIDRIFGSFALLGCKVGGIYSCHKNPSWRKVPSAFYVRDPRYEKLSQDKNPYVFFFINYEF